MSALDVSKRTNKEWRRGKIELTGPPKQVKATEVGEKVPNRRKPGAEPDSRGPSSAYD